jgi:hypothetical protein
MQLKIGDFPGLLLVSVRSQTGDAVNRLIF